MKPVEFPEQNCVLAKDQPQYVPLPVYRSENGVVVSCWSLTWRERWRVLFGGVLWWGVLTFGERLQPQCPYSKCPFDRTKGDR